MNKKLSEICESGVSASTITEEENTIKRKQENPFVSFRNASEEKKNPIDEKSKKSKLKKKCFAFERTGKCVHRESCSYIHAEKVCNIFTALSGECYKGEDCTDRHPGRVCHYWQAGDCGRGQSCAFQHFPGEI